MKTLLSTISLVAAFVLTVSCDVSTIEPNGLTVIGKWENMQQPGSIVEFTIDGEYKNFSDGVEARFVDGSKLVYEVTNTSRKRIDFKVIGSQLTIPGYMELKSDNVVYLAFTNDGKVTFDSEMKRVAH